MASAEAIAPAGHARRMQAFLRDNTGPVALVLGLSLVGLLAHAVPDRTLSFRLVSVCFALAVACCALLCLRLDRSRKVCQGLQHARNDDVHEALHDPLTGAANRRQFERVLDELCGEPAPHHALLFLDLDRFKPVNDLHGHAAGDRLLCDIAAGLRQLARPGDLVARLGGDEFAVLLRRSAAAETRSLATAMLDFVASYRLMWNGQRVTVGTSIGVVTIDTPKLDPATLLEHADRALYAAKEAGRGAAFLARRSAPGKLSFERLDAGAPSPSGSARSHEPEDGMKQILSGSVMASRAASREASDRRHGARRGGGTTRWIHVEPTTVTDIGTSGLSMRDLIVDAAAQADGGADLVRWCIAMVLQHVSRVPAESVRDTVFVLPVPARAAVVVPDLATELCRSEAIAQRNLPHLTLVLHDTSKHHDDPALVQFCDTLRARGIRIGCEVHSTSMEALAVLRHVTVDEIHLGRELLRSILPGSPGRAGLETLGMLATVGGWELVASGVEDVAALGALDAIGVARFSGGAIARCQPLDTLLAD